MPTATKDLRVKPFKMGAYYRALNDPQVVQHIHSKPRDLNNKAHLLVTVRAPSGPNTYYPVFTTVPGGVIDEWEEIDEETFKRTMAGLEEPNLPPAVISAMIEKQRIEDEIKENLVVERYEEP